MSVADRKSLVFADRMKMGLTFSTVAMFSEVQDYVNSDNNRVISFVYQYTGGQIRQERTAADLEKVPAAGTYYRVVGKVGYNTRNRSLIVHAEKFTELLQLSGQEFEDYLFGLRIEGSGILLEKKTFRVRGQASANSCQVAFCGGTLQFKSMVMETWALLPEIRSRLDFVITGKQEEQRDQNGNVYTALIPSFISVTADLSEQSFVTPASTVKMGIDEKSSLAPRMGVK